MQATLNCKIQAVWNSKSASLHFIKIENLNHATTTNFNESTDNSHGLTYEVLPENTLPIMQYKIIRICRKKIKEFSERSSGNYRFSERLYAYAGTRSNLLYEKDFNMNKRDFLVWLYL